MLRSNPSARVDARAWAAMLLSLLILPLHARAAKAINLLEPSTQTSPIKETPWLPFGKISGVEHGPLAAIRRLRVYARNAPATVRHPFGVIFLDTHFRVFALSTAPRKIVSGDPRLHPAGATGHFLPGNCTFRGRNRFVTAASTVAAVRVLRAEDLQGPRSSAVQTARSHHRG